ncbi:MAG: DUF4321 domain-containing protein [Clostridiaceae bacterium]
MKAYNKNPILLVLFIILGGILGTFLGDILGSRISALSFIKTTYNIGTASPLLVDVKILTLTLGINIKLNIMSIIGIILSIIMYRKY